MRALLLVLLAVGAMPALADDEDAALSLADKTANETAHDSDWHVLTEAAWNESILRGKGVPLAGERLSLDVHYDKSFAHDWRAVFSDRLDARWQDAFSHESNVNTLKEGYVTWQARANWIADLGRINTRYGVASGYNPTDYFRADAVRSIVSIDPASLRENRLGSMMLRSQTLWTGGSLTVIYSPKLADAPSDDGFSQDLGATNRHDRWLLATSQKISNYLNPQWLLYGEAGLSPQLGLNLTTLLNDATVAYVEWSGGRTPSLVSRALLALNDTTFRSRLAAGLTHTTASKLSVTIEYEYNGAGLSEADWNALRHGPPADYGRYRDVAAGLQEPPTKQRVFLRAAWQDAFIYRLDLTGNLFYNVTDSSRQPWMEVRYHWMQVDMALQWQLNSGQSGSEYGALPQRQVLQVLMTYFL